MSVLWSTDAMSDAMQAERTGNLPTGISGISIDSRTLSKGDAFFAIQGDNRDGHEFVDAALKAGALSRRPSTRRRRRWPPAAPAILDRSSTPGRCCSPRSAGTMNRARA